MHDHNDFFRRIRASNEPWWRWNRAGDLMALCAEPDQYDDSATVDAWRFRLAAADVIGTPTTESPDSMALAHSLYAENGPRRWEIEARLLAGVSVAEIDSRINLSADQVQWYAATFFDVIGQLNAHDWIWLYAVRVGPFAPAKLSEGDIWRTVAVSGGRAVLDILIADYLGLPEPAYENRAEMAEDIRACVRLGTTPMTDKREFGRIVKRMWQMLAKRQATISDAEWQMAAAHLQHLEMAAGLSDGTAVSRKGLRERAVSKPDQAVGDQRTRLEQLVADHAAYCRR